jgi:hypothetical protein
MLTKEDILNKINEKGEENLTTNLQIKKLEQSIPIQEFYYKGYVTSLDEKNGNIKLELFDNFGKIFNKDSEVIVSLLHPIEGNNIDFTKFNLNDEIQIICTLEKININIKKGYLYVEYYEIYVSVVNPITIELLKTAKEIEERRKIDEKKLIAAENKKRKEREKHIEIEAKKEFEKALWWGGIILFVIFILTKLFIYWFSTLK